MSDNDDFSGPVRNKAKRGPLGLVVDLCENAHAGVKQSIYGIDPARVKKVLTTHGRRVALLSQMNPKDDWMAKHRPKRSSGVDEDGVRIVWVLDTKSGKRTLGRVELPPDSWTSLYSEKFSHHYSMVLFATPFEKRHKLLPMTFNSHGTAVVTEIGEIIGWILVVARTRLFARSADLAGLTKRGVEMIIEISDVNMELVYSSTGNGPGGEWESFARIAPEANLQILCGVHGEVLELLGANVPASAISEGLGPLDYISFASVFKKLASRVIFAAVRKGIATLARKKGITTLAGKNYRFRLVQPNVYSYDGRQIVVVQTSKGPQPFYKRTGGGGANKGGAQPDDWVPYDGHMPNNWFIKDIYTNASKTDPLFRWGTEEFKAVNNWLKHQKLLPAQVIPKGEWRQLMLYFKGVGVKNKHLSSFE